MRQADLAEELKVKRNTVSQYETGDAKPSTVVMARLYNLAPPGQWKDAVHKHLVSDFKGAFPEHPELAESVVADIATSESVLSQFPSTKNPRRAEQLARFAALIPRIAQKPMLDESINNILDNWFMFGSSETVKIFRDAAEHVRIRLEILAGVDTEELEHAEIMRNLAKEARRLAIALLRQADVAEEKGRQVRSAPKQRKSP
jgi:transcriptional regulator with XRE-family HTH domain